MTDCCISSPHLVNVCGCLCNKKHLSFELPFNMSDVLYKPTRTFTVIMVLHNIVFCSPQVTTSWILNKKKTVIFKEYNKYLLGTFF